MIRRSAAFAAAEGDLWGFGWEALVALGTLGLAAATLWLVWTTRSLAQTTAAEVRAQWRPAIVPAVHGERQPLSYKESARVLRVRVRNVGAGPALFVRTTLDPHGASPDEWHLGALAAGDEAALQFSGITLGDFAQVLLDYRDLAGRRYSSALVIDHVVRQDPGGPERHIRRFYDVRLYTDETITSHGDALPQEGLMRLPK